MIFAQVRQVHRTAKGFVCRRSAFLGVAAAMTSALTPELSGTLVCFNDNGDHEFEWPQFGAAFGEKRLGVVINSEGCDREDRHHNVTPVLLRWFTTSEIGSLPKLPALYNYEWTCIS